MRRGAVRSSCTKQRKRRTVLFKFDDVCAQPLRKGLSVQRPGGNIQNNFLLLIDWRADLKSIKFQKYFHRRMSNALVTVNEGMVFDERKSKRAGFVRNRRIKRLAAERHLRLRNRGFKHSAVAQTGRSAASGNCCRMNFENCFETKKIHQASRLYSSSFFLNTRSIARLNLSSLGSIIRSVESAAISTTARRARFSTLKPKSFALA